MLIEWTPGLSVKIEILDNEHQTIIGFLNKLHDAIESKVSIDILDEVIGNLMAYTFYHFNHEEVLFLASDYPDKDDHIQMHKDLTTRLLDIQAKVRHGKSEELSIELMAFLKEWLIHHIQEIDMAYVPYLKQVGKI